MTPLISKGTRAKYVPLYVFLQASPLDEAFLEVREEGFNSIVGPDSSGCSSVPLPTVHVCGAN